MRFYAQKCRGKLVFFMRRNGQQSYCARGVKYGEHASGYSRVATLPRLLGPEDRDKTSIRWTRTEAVAIVISNVMNTVKNNDSVRVLGCLK